MTKPLIVGDTDGIRLWEFIGQSADPIDKENVELTNAVAERTGSVHFTDTVARNVCGKAQAWWHMLWVPADGQWHISCIYTPKGTSKLNERVTAADNSQNWSNVDASDIVSI